MRYVDPIQYTTFIIFYKHKYSAILMLITNGVVCQTLLRWGMNLNNHTSLHRERRARLMRVVSAASVGGLLMWMLLYKFRKIVN